MLLQGFYDPTDIVRCFFECEYAFALKWEKVEIRVTFSKGDWMLEKRKNGKRIDYIEFSDAPGLNFCDNALLKGFIEKVTESTSKLARQDCRYTPAYILAETVNVWGGALKDLQEINVIYPERNTYFDPNTGEITHTS